jgi:hypothetical protein
LVAAKTAILVALLRFFPLNSEGGSAGPQRLLSIRLRRLDHIPARSARENGRTTLSKREFP